MPYKVTADDIGIVDEFMENPVGHHSPHLQKVLNTFRGVPMADKYCLVCIKPHEKWQLAKTTGVRGKPLKMQKEIFTDLLEAERFVFRKRWQQHTGMRLNR